MDLFPELPTVRCLQAIRGRPPGRPRSQPLQRLLRELLCLYPPRNPWSLDCLETERRCPCSGSRNALKIPLLLRRRYELCINRRLQYSMPCSFSFAFVSRDARRCPLEQGSPVRTVVSGVLRSAVQRAKQTPMRQEPAAAGLASRLKLGGDQGAMVVLGTIAVLYFAREILVPFAFALILTFLLTPVVALL